MVRTTLSPSQKGVYRTALKDIEDETPKARHPVPPNSSVKQLRGACSRLKGLVDSGA